MSGALSSNEEVSRDHGKEIERDKNAIKSIVKNYKQREESLVQQLYFEYKSHGPTIGTFRETLWVEMFREMLPGKFAIEQSVFIIDSYGHVSPEIDIAIFDRTYTPYIFRFGRLQFIPIEAVAVVVECKSKTLPVKDLKKWVSSIERLRSYHCDSTSDKRGIARTADAFTGVEGTDYSKTQSSTRPLRILCCLSNSDTKNLIEHLIEQGSFDFVLQAKDDNMYLDVKYDKNDKDTLYYWYRVLCHADIDPEDNTQFAKDRYDLNRKTTYSPNDVRYLLMEDMEKIKLSSYQVKNGNSVCNLLSFNFQLNQLLMLINNPLFFPHRAYVSMFTDVQGE